MRKPSIYIDTNIISAYWYEGSDVFTHAHRVTTRRWWNTERQNFALWGKA